jgi:hypothetical protein
MRSRQKLIKLGGTIEARNEPSVRTAAPHAHSPSICARRAALAGSGAPQAPIWHQSDHSGKAAAVRGYAVFRLPHRALLQKESSAQQGITSDSFDSRSFRIGS